ncbi:MAG: hypothetical protein KGI19_11260 [Thaumarchaeota archaeon]|nr:hypothetical protein [Nitrososphaerota archaeon]
MVKKKIIKKEPEIINEEGQTRWDKVNPALDKINSILYNKELTYNEIDIIMNVLMTRVQANKVVQIALEEIRDITANEKIIKDLEKLERDKYRYIH